MLRVESAIMVIKQREGRKGSCRESTKLIYPANVTDLNIKLGFVVSDIKLGFVVSGVIEIIS